MKRNFIKSKKSGRMVTNVWKYALAVVLLSALGVNDGWASSSDYARGYAEVSSSSPSGAGKVYVAYTSSGGSQPATPAASSSNWKTSEASAQAEGTKTTFDFYYYSLPTSGYALEGWSETNGASDYSNAAVAKYSITTSSCSLNDAYTDVRLYAHFVPNPTVTVTFLTPDPKCTYTVQCDGANVPIGSSKTTNKSFNLAVTVNDANYKLLGWYTTTDGGTTKSYFSPNTTYSNKYFSQTCSVGVELVEAGKPVFMVGNKLFTDLNAANAAASSGSNKTIVLVSDGMLDAGNYTISSGNTLLIPHTIGSTFVNSKSVIDAPYIVKTAAPLSAFRKLTLQDGVNITVNGMLCVAGKMMSSGGGKPSAYPTGEIGMIDMSAGGNITLNGTLYCWGFIKGQDMDQGNNTIGVGTITVNSGATVWEGFATGDWRGGSASSTLYSNASSWKFFPFQSYTIQNIEVPVTYNYGSKLSNYMSIFGDGQVYNGTFDLIGSSNTLFKLSDSASKLKKWYNPQTDLVCYEMSGTTQLDALNVDAAGETVSSADYNLPISTSMHIILASNTTISKPVEIQAGAVIEVKSGVTATCSSNVYVFDKDQWGEYCNSKYYYTMSNLTSHKDRGDGKSNEMIDDAKMIIDGTLNVTGKLYTTTGGADIMGNGGGKIAFNGLGSSTNMVMCTGVSDNENVAINQACLHNEDDSYTKAIASTTFHNVNGRWFKAAAKDEKANHTYDFTYISSGAVSGTGGTNTTTSAVYSNDKTGLETRMKWANVTADGCADWWQGQGEQSTFFYNWTLNSAWHQFIPTEMENVYSGSNNKLYEKSSCTWGEIGETDEDCLYTISGVKKALVDGHFIALEANSNDPAFHLASDATQYYICFAGCNWHEATKYEGENKAYIVDGGNYIWYDGAWLNVQRQEPFFYTLDASNAQVCYEYVNGDWQIALPYVRVSCPTEPDRNLYFFNEALTVASAKKNATITILRDIPDVKVAGVFTGVNTNCTLNLNGHTVTGSVNNLLTVNASGSTFTITDETTEKEGKLNLEFDLNNTRYYTLYVQKGTVVMENGTIAATNTLAYNKTSAPKPLVGGINVAAGATYTMNGGNLTVTAPYNPIGINSSGSASAATTVNINSGSTIDVTATTIDSPYGMYGYATVNFNGGTMNVTANKSTKAYGFHVLAYYKSATNNYVGILNLKGGTVTVKSQGGTAYGIQVNRAVAYDTNEPRNITAQYLAEANISGGELNVITPTKTTAIGISTQGTVDFYGGTINVTPATTTAFGIRIYSGETKIRNTAQLNVTATSIAYGVRISEEAPTTAGLVYKGTLTMSGGKITVNTTSTTDAYGVYVGGLTLANSTTNASNSKSYAGNYASFGTANISGGEIDVKAKTTKAYDIYVKGAVTESGAEGYAAASSTPKCTITGGKYKLQSLTGATTEVAFTNDAATTDNYKISAGYYDNNVNLEDYTVSPAHVVTLPATDANYPEYTYKVAEAYTVTFKNGDETLQSSYQEKGKTPVYLGETPTKASTTTESYIFDGWSTSDGGSIVAPLPNVTSAGATYYAHYNTTALKYIVSLDAVTNGGSCGTDKIYVEPSTAVGELPVATKTGHTFSGWYTAASGGTKLESTTTITADGTYYAQFTVNSYTLTWVLDGGKVSTAGKYGTTSWPAKNATGTQSKAIPFGSALTAPVVARTGYTFQTWSPLVAGIMPAEATTYTAIWLPNSSTAYTVKHYQQNVDGTYPTTPFETESLTGTTATSVTPETKTYDGFISPATQTATIAADGSMVVEYQYARRHYTFILDAATNGGTSDVPSIEVIHGATIGAVPPDAQKGCNDFTGWYTKAVGGVKITSAFVIEYDMKTLYAQFSDDVRTYPIIYNAGAHGTGTVAAETKTCGVNTTLSNSTFTRAGYTQTGWSTTDGSAKAYDLGGSYTANAALTLYPFWTINQYTISFNSAGGSAVASITQDYNTAVTAPANPTKTGYTFAGWDPAVPNPMPAEDMECVAQWTANNYTITYKDQGDAAFSGVHGDGYPTTHTYGAATALVNPTKTGYTFEGWYTLSDCASGLVTGLDATAYTANITLYAKWTANTYEVTLDPRSGSGGSTSVTMTFNSAEHAAITNPTRTGYTFHSWNTTTSSSTRKMVISSKGVMSENVAGYTGAGGVWIRTTMPTTLYARWTENTYAITFTHNGNGSISFNGSVVAAGSTAKVYYHTAKALVATPNTGYHFTGWTKSGTNASKVTIADMSAASTTIKATAKNATVTAGFAPDEYTITYKDQADVVFSGVHGDGYPTTHTYGTATALVDPTKTGYTFAGWYDNADCTGTALTEIGATAYTASFTLYAKWTPNTNTVYTVKHYQQNLDGTYPEEPADTDNETGTTDTEVTPAVKNYTGFTAPDAQTVTVSADGSRVVTYQYTRNSYNLTWDANGGELSGSYTSGLVLFGTTITAPTATRANYDFDGWDEVPAVTMPAEDKTYTAQWSLSAVTILWKSEDGSETLETDDAVLIGATPSFDGTTPAKATTESYTYTFDGWTTEANGAGTFYAIGELPTVSSAATYYAHFTATANVASVKVGSADPTYYTDFAEAWDATNSATGEVTLKLLQEVSGVTTSLAYTNAQNCTLDLNNHTILGSVSDRLLEINAAGKTFTIDDGSAEKGGRLENSKAGKARYYAVYLSAGILNLEHGTIHSSNPSDATYSTLTTNAKKCIATGVYVAASQTFNMNGGEVSASAIYLPIGIQSAGYVNVNGGLVAATATKFSTAYGIYAGSTTKIYDGATITAISTNSTSTYGIYIAAGTTTLYGGKIESYATSASGTTAIGVYAYKGNLSVPESSTVDVIAKSYGKTCYGVQVAASRTATIKAGSYAATSTKASTASGVYSLGTTTISGGTFTISTKTTNAYGVYATRGKITVNGSPIFNVTAGSTTAYGAFAYGTVGANGKSKYSGTIEINGGTFNVTTTTTTAYGAYAGLYSRTVNLVIPENAADTIAGQHYMPGILVVNDGTFNVKATTTGAFGIVVAKAKSESGTVGTTARIPLGTVTGGKFKVESMGDANATAYAMNSATTAARLVVQGGYYNTKRTDASETSNIEDKYTSPTKDCNFFTLETTEEDKATVGSDYNYKVVEIIDIGDRLDIIDWTTTTLTINANGWAASGWPYTINGTPYEKEARAADRTLTIPYSAEAGTDLRIRVQSGGSLTSLHYYTVPFIGTTEGAGEEDVVYVNEGTLTISSNTTLAALYIRPEASVEVTSGTLTVGKLVMRTLPWQAAAISGNFTASETWYTRIAPNKRTITGPYAPITYESARYYQFALPRACTEKLKDIQVSNAANTPYGNTWLLKRYNEETRAEKGIGEANWVALGNEEYIQGGVGYEMFSNSNYYREFYFPLGAVSSASLGNTTAVSYDMGAAGEKHAGWNWVSSPLMSVYDNSDADPEEGMKIGILMTDGSYDQGVPEYIYPAIPFSYQASEGQSVISFEGSSIVAAAPQRRAAADEFVRKQWIHVNIQDEDGIGDHTSILAHPTRYEQTYKTGIDVAKQSFTASRPLIYSSHTYGEMAFAAVADSLLEIGIPLTVYSPKPQELTISMRDNNWLDRLAEVWLVDMETGAQTDLFDSDYTFEATEGTTRGRIFLMGRFKAPNIATDIETTEANEDQNMKAQKLIIRDKLYIRLNGQLYDATGKLVNDK